MFNIVKNKVTGEYKSSGFSDFTGQFDPALYEQILGMPEDLKLLISEQNKSNKELISEAFAQLPKASRNRLRKYITEGFVAMEAGSLISLQDIIEEASLNVSNQTEIDFITYIGTLNL